MIEQIPPSPQTAEISLFGPGIGECSVIHYGNGHWFIIDSCLCPDTKKPIALKYLESLGVDVSTQVKGVLVTHWHSDHIQGITDIVKTCHLAKLYIPRALLDAQAMNLVHPFLGGEFSDSDKEIKEYSQVIKYLFDSGESNRVSMLGVRTTIIDNREPNIRLVALSPSDHAQIQSIARLKEKLPKPGERRLRMSPEGDNLNAVALHFTFGDISVLLGSDLEDTKSGNTNTGWSAVFDSDVISDLDLSKSSIYKVSHHGSITGNHERIWDDLLTDNPLSITTPFSRHKLPKESDIERTISSSSSFIVTRKSEPVSKNKIKRDSSVERWIKIQAVDRYIVNDKMGHIQIRADLLGNVNVLKCDNCVEYVAE